MRIFLTSILCVFLSTPAIAASFVSPIGFEPTEQNKAAVVEYIKQDVKETYSRLGMDSESTLRMMEKKNLDAFKELLKAEDSETLARVIKRYCDIDVCNYSTILMMYKKEIKSKKQSLSW